MAFELSLGRQTINDVNQQRRHGKDCVLNILLIVVEFCKGSFSGSFSNTIVAFVATPENEGIFFFLVCLANDRLLLKSGIIFLKVPKIEPLIVIKMATAFSKS